MPLRLPWDLRFPRISSILVTEFAWVFETSLSAKMRLVYLLARAFLVVSFGELRTKQRHSIAIALAERLLRQAGDAVRPR